MGLAASSKARSGDLAVAPGNSPVNDASSTFPRMLGKAIDIPQDFKKVESPWL